MGLFYQTTTDPSSRGSASGLRMTLGGIFPQPVEPACAGGLEVGAVATGRQDGGAKLGCSVDVGSTYPDSIGDRPYEVCLHRPLKMCEVPWSACGLPAQAGWTPLWIEEKEEGEGGVEPPQSKVPPAQGDRCCPRQGGAHPPLRPLYPRGPHSLASSIGRNERKNEGQCPKRQTRMQRRRRSLCDKMTEMAIGADMRLRAAIVAQGHFVFVSDVEQGRFRTGYGRRQTVDGGTRFRIANSGFRMGTRASQKSKGKSSADLQVGSRFLGSRTPSRILTPSIWNLFAWSRVSNPESRIPSR
jgi:hypothetical protein